MDFMLLVAHRSLQAGGPTYRAVGAQRFYGQASIPPLAREIERL